MKKYQKPEISLSEMISKEKMSSLGEWLESSDGEQYEQAGITTYVLNS